MVEALRRPSFGTPPRHIGEGQNIGGWNHKLFLFGGNANNGANCGLAYVNSNNDFGIVNGNYGARLTMT